MKSNIETSSLNKSTVTGQGVVSFVVVVLFCFLPYMGMTAISVM